MDPAQVYRKTPKGLAEVRQRALGLPPPQRILLIVTDGAQAAGELARLYPVPDFERHLEALQSLELIEPVAQADTPSGSSPPVPGADQAEFERLRAALQFLNESAGKMLGLGGFRFNLKIQRCNTLNDLRALVPEYRTALVKRHGEDVADLMTRRLTELIG